MTRLYTINHDLSGPLWCGPAAIAAVTGSPTSTIVAKARTVRDFDRGPTPTGRARPIVGMTTLEVADVIRLLGRQANYEMIRRPRPTFAQWLKSRDRASVYVVAVSRHFVTVAGNKLVDNQHREWISPRAYAKQRARVTAVIKVVP